MRYDLDEIRSRARVADVLAHHGAAMAPGRRRGPCPLCDATSGDPFATRDDGRRWKCFACGRGGSVIDLEAELGGVVFREAALALAGRLGLVQVDDATASQRASDRAKAALVQAISERMERGGWQLAASELEAAGRVREALVGASPESPLALAIAADAAERAEWAERRAGADPAPRSPLVLAVG